MPMGGAFIWQIAIAAVIGLVCWKLLRGRQGGKMVMERESKREMEKLKKLRDISLTEPLSERTRPTKFEEIVGQAQGLKALKAVLCGPNPQHVIIYGPPGVGKTAAARLVLEEAKRNCDSPFSESAQFTEVDATTSRFDERGIADPLIGSVHDPIYQGAGPLGMAGVPQPKPGAVTKAHGGLLFIDEIGELHPVQMNKLLKVLEDRKVFLESAYYNSEDASVPAHIHDIFENGLPADFRLVGATTRLPQEIPPAIRSRCVEVFFRPLLPEEVGAIALNATRKISYDIEPDAIKVIEKYSTNGREAVNISQIAAGIALSEKRRNILCADVEWVINSGQYSPRPECKIQPSSQVGVATGMAVCGPATGTLLEVEASTVTADRKGAGRMIVTGMIEEEEMGGFGRTLRRKSTALGSVDNVLTVLRRYLNVNPCDYDIHVNFPGGMPLDGPSAGATMATAIYSSLTGKPVINTVALTGEVSIRGKIRPVGGIIPKIEAARRGGVKVALIPQDNWQETFKDMTDITIQPIETLEQALQHALLDYKEQAAPVALAGSGQQS